MTSPRSLFAASVAMSITASLNACSSAASVSTPEPVQAQAASALTTVPTAVAPEAAPPAPTPPAVVVPPPELDLLHAVRSDLAASSAYRNQSSQVAALIDGDLETAWNSRTGELVGAAIEVRLPADVQVNAIALTAGFTHMQRDTDLFTGNHRVVHIRVLHDGTEVGSFPLDVNVRTLQRLPLQGTGGVYRIEVTEVLAGTRDTWRETCISELQILGMAPNAMPGTRIPHLTIGALPAAAVVTPPSREAVARAHRQRVAAIERQWLELEQIANGGREGSAPDEDWDMGANDLDRARRAVLEQTATFVAPIDEVQADALRILALRALTHSWPDWQHLPLLRDELVALGRAMDAVSTWLNDDEARCRWARALGHLHLARARSMTRAEREHTELDDSMHELDGTRPAPGAGQRINSLWSAAETLDEIEFEWSRNTRGMAARVMRLHLPEGARANPELDIVRAQIEVAQRTCGWQ